MCVKGGKNDAAMRLKVYTALLLLTDGGYYSEIRHHVYIYTNMHILTTGLKNKIPLSFPGLMVVSELDPHMWGVWFRD